MTKFNAVIVDNWARDYNGGKSERLAGGPFDLEADAKRCADEWNDAHNPSGQGGDYAIVRDASKALYVFEGY